MRTALVTGAASGIGRATARLLASHGLHVAATDLHAPDALADEIRAQGGSAEAHALDVGDPHAIATVIPTAAQAFSRLDVLVNNAGIAGFAPLDDAGYDDLFTRMLTVNLAAHQRTIRAALPYLRASPSARVINIASTEALGATPLDSAYAAAKAGVTGLTRGLAVDLGREGITVNCVCPGPIETGMTAAIPDADKAIYARRRTALRRYGRPEEVAHAVWMLAHEGASFITGATLPADGGLMARNA
jgi:3-oxoacyl-[acyl-carrier protein] reductase